VFWLLMVGLTIVLVAPLRRAFFCSWRFTVPAVAALLGGLVFTAWLVGFGIPGWAMLFLPPVMALGVGAGAKQWLDQNLGPPRDNN